VEETWELAAVSEEQRRKEKYIDSIAELQTLYKNGILLFGVPLAALVSQFKFIIGFKVTTIKVLLTVSVILFLFGLIAAVIRSEQMKVYVATLKMKLHADIDSGEGIIADYLSGVYGTNDSEQDFVNRIKKPVLVLAYSALFGWKILIANRGEIACRLDVLNHA